MKLFAFLSRLFAPVGPAPSIVRAGGADTDKTQGTKPWILYIR